MDFYVYIHRRETDGQIYYVGKGQGQRAWDFLRRNNHWHNTHNKHGTTVQVVSNGLQEWYALELETELIALYGRQDLNLGPLVNKTDGGEGGSGRVLSEDAKQHLSLCLKNRKFRPETIARMSQAKQKVFEGKNNPRAIAVTVEFITGEQKHFDTAKDAAQWLGTNQFNLYNWKNGKAKIPKKYGVKSVTPQTLDLAP